MSAPNNSPKDFKPNILIHVSGSISAFKAATLASLLMKDGWGVRVSMSKGGSRFIGAPTFEGITNTKILTDMFDGDPDFRPHITIAQNWADLILVYPASANCINRLAAGLSDDFFGAIYLAAGTETPVWVAPGMNSGMLDHPRVQKSLKELEWAGNRVFPTGEGMLACGAVGKGRLIEPDQMFQELLTWKNNQAAEKAEVNTGH